MKQIPLTQGKFALVDDEQFEYLSQWKWHCNGTGYAVYTQHHPTKKDIYMHKLITPSPVGMNTDHINGNRLDNQKNNLRVCTPADNARNRRTPNNNTSGYMGVCWHKKANKWVAQIGTRGIKGTSHIGVFETALDAARAYNEKARELFGDFARLNEIPNE